MINYLSSFTNTNGVAFPDTLGINASGPSATDGTEFVKLFIDDLWGARQALMDYAGLTPDTVTEAPGTAQTIEAIQKGFAVGPGMGNIYWKDGDPAANGDRVLLLNGQGVLRATYPELDAAVYVGDGNNPTASRFYHADDAAGTIRNIAGVYLILPETRGYVLRGLDTAASVDPDGASRDMGSIQLDALQGHLFYNGVGRPTDVFPFVYGGTTNEIPGLSTNHMTTGATAIGFQGLTSLPKTDGVNGTPRISSESRGVNVATRYGITY